MSELIAGKSIFYRLLFLHAIFARLLPNSWHYMMPKNRVVVFDDLERLHQGDGSVYLDLIGIIEYLKNKCGCKILLIANTLEVNDDCFNSYMEK